MVKEDGLWNHTSSCLNFDLVRTNRIRNLVSIQHVLVD